MDERKRQDEQWGGAPHDDQHTVNDWFAIIENQLDKPYPKNSETPFIKMAAICISALEAFERKRQNTHNGHDRV